METVQNEKAKLIDEEEKNQRAIKDYTEELRELKGELESMKHVIAHTFEDELKTGGSMNTYGSKMSKRV